MNEQKQIFFKFICLLEEFGIVLTWNEQIGVVKGELNPKILIFQLKTIRSIPPDPPSPVHPSLAFLKSWAAVGGVMFRPGGLVNFC